MPRKLTLLSLLFALLPRAAAAPGSDFQPRVVAYYTAWSIYTAQYFVTDIPADRITHVNYAFMNVSADGECVLGDPNADVLFTYPNDLPNEPLKGNLKQLALLKISHPRLKILMSVGGATWSGNFSQAALTDESRARFASSCLTLMQNYSFDGIDLDWEFPVVSGGRAEDRANFTLLLAEFRRQLDAAGSYILTIAAPQIPESMLGMELDKIHPYLDWINVMTYSFHGANSTRTYHHAPLYASSNEPDSTRTNYNVDAALGAYLAVGVPSRKLVMGVPFYGQGWAGVSLENNGLYQSFTGLPQGTFGNDIYTYRDLAANYIDHFTRYWDAEAQVPWLYDPAQGIMISYEDADSVRNKAGYVIDHDLGGMMVWELSYDDPEDSLLGIIAGQLRVGGS